jgi:hypothetical protein
MHLRVSFPDGATTHKYLGYLHSHTCASAFFVNISMTPAMNSRTKYCHSWLLIFVETLFEMRQFVLLWNLGIFKPFTILQGMPMERS